MKKIKVVLIAMLALLLLTGGSVMAEENAVPSATQAGKGFVVEGSAEGYNYEGGILTFVKTGSYTVSMAPNVTETTDVILINGTGSFALTINGIKVATSAEGDASMPLSVRQGDLSLTLEGESSLQSDLSSALYIGDGSGDTNDSSLTVNGTGKLNLRSGQEFALESLGMGGNIIESGEIYTVNGIVAAQRVPAVAGEPQDGQGDYAISAHFAEKLTMNGGSLTAVVEGSEAAPFSGAVYCYNGLEVNGGTLSGKAPGGGISTGDGSGKGGGTCVINGGSVIGDAVLGDKVYGTCGFSAMGEITINGGSVTAQDGYVGIGASRALTINGGQINATGAHVGINGGGFAVNKERDILTITGGTIYASGKDYDLFGGDFGDTKDYTKIFLQGGSIFTGGNKIMPAPLSYYDEDDNIEVKAELVTLTGLPADSGLDFFFKAGFFGEKKADPVNGAYGIRDMRTDKDGRLCVYVSTGEENPFGVTIGGVDYEGMAEDGNHGYTAEMKPAVPDMKVTSENGHVPYYFSSHYVLEPGSSTAAMAKGKAESSERIFIGKPSVMVPEDVTADYYRLTLDNVHINTRYDSIYINHRNVEIITRGDNYITADEGHAIDSVILADDDRIGTLAFGGSGSLNCDVAADKKYPAIFGGRFIVVNSGVITAHSTQSAAIMTKSATDDLNDSITVNGGEINVSGPFGLYGSSITINGGRVSGISEGSDEGLVVGSTGDITFNGGSVKLNSQSYAVGAGGTLTINGGTHRLLAENDKDQKAYGLYANGGIHVSGGTTWVSGGASDLKAEAPDPDSPLPTVGKQKARAVTVADGPAIIVDGGSLNAVHNTLSPEPEDTSGARLYKTMLTVGTAANLGSLEGMVGEIALSLKDTVTDEAANLYLYLPDPGGQKAIVTTASNAYRGTVRELEAQNKQRTFGAVLVSDKPEPVVRVTGVELDKTSAELAQGKSMKLTASVKPANATNKNVSWKSSDVRIAKVDNQGKVTGVSVGKATITVTTEDGAKSASAVITVKKAGGNGPNTGVLSEQASIPAALILLAGFAGLAAVAARRK